MKIHLHGREGIYSVDFYTNTELLLSTAKYRFRVPASEFKCLAGGLHNFNLSAEEANAFYGVVCPEQVRQTDLKRNAMLELLKEIEDKQVKSEPKIELGPERDEAYWEQRYDDKCDELRVAKDKSRKVIDILYKDLGSLDLDEIDLSENCGKKFIIQENEPECMYRFKFDPFGIVDNMHTSLSYLFMENNWGTVNGGWIKIFGNTVFLYGKSGDYGAFEAQVARKAFKALYPKYEVKTYPSHSWIDVVEVESLNQI